MRVTCCILYIMALSDAAGELACFCWRDFVPMPDYVVKTLQPPFSLTACCILCVCGFYVGVPLLAMRLAYILFLAAAAGTLPMEAFRSFTRSGVWEICFKSKNGF